MVFFENLGPAISLEWTTRCNDCLNVMLPEERFTFGKEGALPLLGLIIKEARAIERIKQNTILDGIQKAIGQPQRLDIV